MAIQRLINLPFKLQSRAYSRLSAGAIHAFITFLIFSPYFLSGQMPLWSFDNLYGSLPLFPYSFESLSQGWSGWLPYSASGSDFSGNVGNFTYSPFFLPIVLFGEDFIWHYVAFLEILSFWAVGFLFFLLCEKIIEDRGWALFSSISLQLGLTTLYTLQTFPNTLVYACFLLACYAMWRLDDWNPKLSMFVLVFALYGMITSGHYVYGVYWGVFLTVLFIYRHGLHPLDVFRRFSVTQIFAVSGLIALMIGAVRLVPIFDLLRESSRVWDSVLLGHFSRIYAGLFLMIPEIFGITHSDTLELAERTSGYFGGAYQYGGNQHSYFFFAGILTTFFLVLGFFSRHIRGGTFWKWLAFWFLAYNLWLLPFTFLSNLLFYPYQHGAAIMGVGFAFSVLAGYVGKQLSGGFAQIQEKGIPPLKAGALGLSPLFLSSTIICALALYFVAAYGFVVYQDVWDKGGQLVLIVKTFLFLPLFLAFLIYAYREHPKLGPLYIRFGLSFFGLVLFSLLVLGATTAYLGQTGLQKLFGLAVNPSGNSEIFTNAVTLDWIGILLIVLIGAWVWFRPENIRIKHLLSMVFVFGVSICVQWLGAPEAGTYQAIMPEPSRLESEILVITGISRLVLVFAVLILLFYRMEKGRLKAGMFSAVSCCVLLAVTVPVFKEFSYFIARPFLNVEGGMLYPPRQAYQGLDLKNYRVNFPHQLVPSSEIYRPRAGQEEISNLPLIYGLPSYGSLNSHFTPLDMGFLRTLGGVNPFFGQASNLTDPRFLDLSGSRYDFSQGVMMERPAALSRFMFFTDYEVIRDGEDALKRLKDPMFDPASKILISSDIGLMTTRKLPGRKIDYTESSYDDLSLAIIAKNAGVLLFNDTHSTGWEAWVDGVPVQIFHANYKFMGIYISEGSHDINFLYRPRGKRIGLFISGFGLIFLLGLLLWPASAGIHNPSLSRRR